MSDFDGYSFALCKTYMGDGYVENTLFKFVSQAAKLTDLECMDEADVMPLTDLLYCINASVKLDSIGLGCCHLIAMHLIQLTTRTVFVAGRLSKVVEVSMSIPVLTIIYLLRSCLHGRYWT